MSLRLLIAAGRLAACAASLMFAIAQPARADEVIQHNELVNTFITQMHADPLVADCAAHGNFVASTSSALDHVEFPPSAFDSTHASVTPWNDSFDSGKQRVKVDTIVTVEGVGIPQSSNRAPYDLRFRCGYSNNQMLAFSWNDPVPPARPRAEPRRAPHGKDKGRGRGKHSTKAAGKHTAKAMSGHAHHSAHSAHSARSGHPGHSGHKASASHSTAKSGGKKATAKKKKK